MGQMKVFTPKIKQTLELFAEVSELKQFFIQDTETTGLDRDSEIYEFAGVLYDGTKTGDARFKKIHYYLKPTRTTLNALKARGALEEKNPWEHAITDEELNDLANNPGKHHTETGGMFITNEDFAKVMTRIFGVPQFTYNAVFDVNKELNYLPSNYRLKTDVYDAATMVIDLFPNIIGDESYVGKYTLDKIYNILCRDYKKIIGVPGKTFPGSYGGKRLKDGQKHTAISDVVDMLVPVLGAIADFIKMHPDWKIQNYKGVQYYSVKGTKKNAAGQNEFKTEGEKLTDEAEIQRELKRAGLQGKIIPWKILTNGRYMAGALATKLKRQVKNGIGFHDFMNLLDPATKSGAIHLKRFELLGDKRSKTMKSLTNDIYGNGKYNTAKLIENMNGILVKKGFVPQYYYNKGTGSVTVYLVPSNIATIQAMKEIPSFRFFLARSDGSINLYTRTGTAYKGVNGIYSDFVDGKGVVYTAEQLQLMEILRNVTRVSSGDPEQAAKTLNYAVRNSAQRLEALQDFVTGDTEQELSKEKSGTGSSPQMKARLGFLRNERFVVHLVEKYQQELLDLFWSSDSRAFRRSKKADCINDIYMDINDIINQLGTFGAKKGNIIIKNEPRYAYIRKNPSLWNEIKKIINSSIGKLEFQPGSAGENSVSSMSVSLTRPDELNLFGMSPMDRRHSLQSSHYYAAGKKSQQIREQRKSLVSEALLQAGVKPGSLETAYAKVQFATTADYTKAYKEVKARKLKAGMSEAEFIRIYGTAQHGIHSGGSIYQQGSRFEKEYLDAAKEGSAEIKINEVYEWLFRHRRKYFDINKGDKTWRVDSQGYIVTNPQYSDQLLDQWYCEAIAAVGRLPGDASFTLGDVVPVEDKTKLRVYFRTDKPMRGAGKVLVGGFDERTMAVGIHPDIYKQILKNKGLSADTEFLMNPDEGKFSSKHLSGLIGSYLNAIIVHGGALSNLKKNQGRPQAILSIIEGYNALKGVLAFDSSSQSLYIRDQGLSRAIQENGVDDVIRALNELGEKIWKKPGFIEVTEKDDQGHKITKGWKVSSSWKGYTAINQADLYEYGAPGGRVVSFDYRAQHAASRMMNIAGLKGSITEKVIMSGMTASKEMLKEYKKIKTDVDRAIARSKQTAQTDFDQTTLANCVCIGWGSNVPTGGIDLSDPSFSTKIRGDDGKFDPDLYAKSVYGAIDRARKAKAKELGKKPEDIMVYVDLQETFSESTMYSGSDRLYGQAVRYLFLPNFSRMGTGKSNNEYGNMPAYEKEFDSLLYNIRRYNEYKENNMSDADIARQRNVVGQRIFGFEHAMYDDVYNKEGATYRRFNSRRATHSQSATASAGNYTLTNDRDFSAVERKLASTSGLISYEDMFTLVNSDETREANNLKEKRQARAGHIAILQETLRELWAGQEAEVPKIISDFMKKYVAKDCQDIELMTERHKRGEEALKDRLSKEGKTVDQIQKACRGYAKHCQEEKKKLMEKISAQVETILKNIFTKSPEELIKSADPIDNLIVSIFGIDETGISKTSAYEVLNEVLSAFIVESVTLGSNIFEQRSEANKMKGMSGVFMRYPLSNGLDIQFTDFYVDKAGVVRGTIILGQGTAHETHLDYDGDHPPMWLPFMDANTLGKAPEKIRENLKQINKEYAQLKEVNQKMRSGLAFIDKVTLDPKEQELYYIASKEAEEFGEDSFMAQIAAILAGRKYKGDVGRLSNTYQAVANALYMHKLDEAGLRSKSKKAKLRALRSIALRAFFETLTQDAISSKKVYKRLKNAGNIQSVMYDLEILLDKIHEGLVYQNDTALTELFKLLRKMNLGEMETRIIYNIVAVGQAVDPTGEVLDALFGKGIGQQFLMDFDENNQATGFRGIDKSSSDFITKSQDRVQQMKNAFTDNFMKEVIKASESELSKATKTQYNKYGTSIDRAMNMRLYRIGMGKASAYSLSIGQTQQGQVIRIQGITKEELEKLTPEARKQFDDALHQYRIDNKARGIPLVIESEDEYGKYLANSLDEILNATGSGYQMYSVYTGLDKSGGQHRSYVDERRYSRAQYAKMKDLKTYSVTQIASVLYIGGSSNNLFPAEYGTFFHAIIEAVANGEIEMDSNYQIVPESLRRWIEGIWKGENPKYDRSDVAVAIETNPNDPTVWCVSQQMLDTVLDKSNILISNLRDEYPDAFSSINDVQSRLQVVSETTHGIILRLGERNVVISGTIDQIWMGYKTLDDVVSSMSISDIKTSKYAYLEYIVQLSLYGAILRAWEKDRGSGNTVSNKAKLTLNPRGSGVNGVVDVNMIPDEQLLNFVRDAINILEMQDSPDKEVAILNLARRWNPYLVSRLELNAESVTIDDIGTQKFSIGGSELSTILKAQTNEMPLTALEQRLYDRYLFFKNGNDKDAQKGYEHFVNTLLKKGVITQEEYNQHIAFRAARGQYVYDYLSRIKDENQRQEAIRRILLMREGAEENSIVYDFGLRIGYLRGTNSRKIQRADISQFYSEDINALTYNYDELFHTNEKKEDDDMALVDELIKFLTNYKNGQGDATGHAPTSGTGASSSPQYERMSEDAKANFSLVGGVEKYYQLQKQNELLSLQLYRLDPNSAEYNNTLAQIEKNNAEMNSDTFAAMKKEAGESWDKNLQKQRETDENHRLKILEEENKLLAKQKEILDDIAKLDARINNAEKEKKVSEAEELKKQKHKLEAQLLTNKVTDVNTVLSPEGVVTLNGIMSGGSDAGDLIGARGDDSARAEALRRYKSLMTQRSRDAATSYDLSLTYRTTYDKLYKQSILEQMDNLSVQNQLTEEEIKKIVQEYKNDPVFIAQQEKINKVIEAQDTVRRGRIDVKHKGQDTLWGQLGSQMTNIITRFTQMGAAYRIIGKIRQGFSQVIQSAKELDKAMTDLRIVTGQNGTEASHTMQQFSKLAKQLGVTTTEVAQAGTAWLRQGYTISEATDLITSSMYLSRLGMISVDEATKDLTSSLKGFKLEAKDAMSVVDKLTALDVKAATTAGEIATGLAQFANLAKMNGIDIDQAAAMVATIADVSQVSGSQAGNSIKMMLSRFGTVKSGKFDSMQEGEEGTSLNDVEKVLNRIGVSIRDSNLQFREFDEVLDDIAEKWDMIDNVSQNAIATALAGTRQREAFLVLMSNMDKYKELTKESENSEGTAQGKYQSYSEQLEASQKRLNAAWEELAQSASVSKFLTSLNNIATFLVDKLPVILKYVARLIAMTQGYKLPKMMSNMGLLDPFVNGYDKAREAFTAAKSGGKGAFKKGLKNIFGGNYNKKIQDYYNEKQGGIFDKVIGPVNELTKALVQLKETIEGKKEDDEEAATEEAEIADQKHEDSLNEQQASTQQANAANQNTNSVTQNSQDLDENSQSVDNNTQAQSNNTGNKTTGDTTDRMTVWGKIASGISTGITTALTTDTTQYDIYHTGDTETKSQGLRMGAKINTGVATGLATAFLGSAGGMLTSLLFEKVLNPLILPWFEKMFDNDSYQLKILDKAAKKAEENLQTISTLEGQTETLVSLSREDVLIGESYTEAQKTFDDMAETIFADQNSTELWRQIVENTGGTITSVTELKKSYLTGSKKQREEIAAALQASLAWQEAREFAATKNDDFYRLSMDTRQAKKISSGWNLQSFTLGGLFTGLTNGGASGNAWTDAGAAMSTNVASKIGIFSPDLTTNLVTSLIAGIQGRVNRENQKTNFTDWLRQNNYGSSIKTRDTTFDSKKGFWDNVATYAPLFFGVPSLKTTSETYIDLSDEEMARAMSGYVDDLQAKQERYIQIQEEYEKIKNKEIEATKEHTEAVLLEYMTTKDVSKELEEYEENLKQLNKAIEQRKLYYDQINSKYAAAAVASADLDGTLLSTLGNRQLKGLGKDEIVKLIAKELEENGGLMGYNIYDSNGEVSGQAKDYILSAMKADTSLWGIISGASYTLSELLDTNGDAAKDAEGQAAALQQFAAALGVSVDQLKELEDTFGNLTLGQVMASPEETRNSIGELTTLFTSMASSTGLTAENLEMIINKFPELIEYLGNASRLAEAMSDEISALVKVYAANIGSQLLSSEGYFNQFITKMKTANPELYAALNDKNSPSKIFANANSFEDIAEILYGNAADYGLTEEQQEELRKMVADAFDLEVENTVEQERIMQAINYQTKMYERQIESLEEQKAALEEINNQREYENKLIEAKLKLEDAQREKKRVWREGVGWVYESDQKSIDEAQKALDEVENEKKISELETQIQQLQGEKEYLENLPNEKELKNMQEVYEGWAKEVGLYNKSQSEVLQRIGEIYNGIEKISLGKYFEEYIKDKQQQSKDVEDEATRLLGLFTDADKEYQDLINSGADRNSEKFIQVEENRNRALLDYQSYIDNNKGSISQGWFNTHNDEDSAARGATTQNWAGFTIEGTNGETYRVDGQPLSENDQHFKWIQDDATNKDNKKDAAFWQPTNSAHTALVGKPIEITKSMFESYDNSLAQWAQDPNHQNTMIVGALGDDEYGYIKNQEVHKVQKAALGTLGTSGGPILLNEQGTEAIITPQGTITSLPSGTGVVPADVTRNVWQLGELAPAILRSLGYPNNLTLSGSSSSINNSEAVNIGTITMNVNADENWDALKFVEQLKQQASLSKNNKR